MEGNIHKKLGIGSLTAVFVAYTCSVTSVPNGAIIGEYTTFAEGMIGIALAFVLAAVVSALVSYVSFKTGQTKDIVFKTIFGRRGFMLCSLIFAFCQSFWACFDFFNAGQAIYNLMPEGSIFKNLGFCIAIAVMLVLTILGGVFGIHGVKWISTLTIPVAVILFLIIYFVCLVKSGGYSELLEYVPVENTLGVSGAAQIMFGMWMAGYVGMMDLTPEAKNGKAVVIASICGAAFIMLCFMVGQMGFIGTGFKTVGDICLSLGGAIFICGNLFVIVAQGNTTPACNYMYSLSYSEGLNLPRKPLAVIVPCLVAILAFIIMYGPGVDFISNITNVVSTLMGPLIGVVLAEFYVIEKCGLELEEENNLPIIKAAAFTALLIGVAISLLFNNLVAVPLPGPLTIVATGLVHLVLKLGFKMK